MNSSRATVEKLLERFEIARRSRSKDVRFNPKDIQEFELALTQILLQNSETKEENLKLKTQLLRMKKEYDAVADKSDNEIYLDGGSFKNE